MFSRVIPIRRLLYGSLAPVGGGAQPARLAASDHSAPSAGAMPERRFSPAPKPAQEGVSSPVGSLITPVR